MFKALLAQDPHADHPHLLSANPNDDNADVPRKFYTLAARGDIVAADRLFEDWRATHEPDDEDLLQYAPATGRRELANEVAARIDDHNFGRVAIWNW